MPSPLDEIVRFVVAERRVCPSQDAWQALHRVIADAAGRAGAGSVPAPFLGPAWAATSTLMKRERLRRQLEIAANCHCLDDASAMLRGFDRRDWAYESDFDHSRPADLAPNGRPAPDPDAKTVSIPVEVVDGRLSQFGGKRLPKLGNGIGQLVLPAFTLVDEEQREQFTREEVKQVLERRTVLRCRVSGRRVPAELLPRCVYHAVRDSFMSGVFVEVVLDESLELRLRGTKRAQLQGVRCRVSALDDLQCVSLNEAYRRISRVFEPTRRAEGGNVFLNFYFFDEERGAWRLLGELRGDVYVGPR